MGADVEEVVDYVKAMELGLAGLARLPLSVRLLREMHEVILAGVRRRSRQPVQAALVHFQFETIHPFLDGNGRLGRLLIVFFLVVRDRLPAALLCLSPYFEERREEYYDALQGVRERGDFPRWLAMFLDGVTAQATDAVTRAERLLDLRERYRRVVQDSTRGAANSLVDIAFEYPVLTTRLAERLLGTTRPSAISALRSLAELGLLTEVATGPRRQLRWRAQEVLEVLTDA